MEHRDPSGVYGQIILLAALSTLNATIFTGARVFYVMARDMTVMSPE